MEPLVVIVPVYNAEPTLVNVVKGVRRNLPGAQIIGVDDGSTDGSRKLLRTVADDTIEFDKNRGKGAALRAAFEKALANGAAAVLTIDSDGQHDPADPQGRRHPRGKEDHAFVRVRARAG